MAKKSKLDDDFHSYLVEGVNLLGDAGIPELLDLHNTEIPVDLIPFEKARNSSKKEDRKKYIHFYQFDGTFSDVLTSTRKYLKLFQTYAGVISPDCSLLIGQAKCLQQTNTYFNRAVGVYLQKHGIPVIPNVRWSDEQSYEYCFLGIPKHSIVSISTHGCVDRSEKYVREVFKKGLAKMLEVLEPSTIVVHGYMPDDIFGEYLDKYHFVRYKSQLERTHESDEKSEEV